MASGFSIASFNVRNFNTDSSGNRQFKEEKQRKITALIETKGFNVVALQEIQTDNTVRDIVKMLNGGPEHGTYDYVHCRSIYDDLKTQGYAFKSESQSRGELAFIWDTRSVKLEGRESLFLYKGIDERLNHAIDTFVSIAAAMFSGFLATQKHEKSDSKLPGGSNAVGAVAVAAAGYGVHRQMVEAEQTRASETHKRSSEILRNLIRPPLVGIFTKNSDRNKQLRIINVHSQFGKTAFDNDCGRTIRKAEAKFLMKDVFEIVNSQRCGDCKTAFTMIAGDFNLRLSDLEQVARIPSVVATNPDMVASQDEKSTVKVSNQQEVDRKGEQRKYEQVHDYDHFIFSSDCWKKENAELALTLNDESFYVLKGNERRAMSDHLPIVISSDKF